MILIRCECGQGLGKVKGEYDLRCPKCGLHNIGNTDKLRRVEFQLNNRPVKVPREMVPVR